ncbi:hypothetical protein [Mycobacterium sp. AT1]|uniref:MaoC family dehydratase n=1 Tax=Mycobacterium sp. AT1 TaxID=1961706 RepID=UPI0009D2D312|nr:hypothetical protein [Mycobacterium sp. AT1]OPX10799.1 hypothetical protein B1790_10615 [Mycobacterium sp. AT1]
MTGSSLFLEDFAPGQRFVSDEIRFDDHDLRAFGEVSGDRHPLHTPGLGDAVGPVAHGPLAIARYYGTVFDAGVLRDSLVGALDVHWQFTAPLRVGVPVHYETLVTGWRRSRSNTAQGIVFRTIWLKDADGVVVQRGASSVVVRALRADATDDPSWALPVSPEWTAAVVARLEDTADFHDATQLFDGTIGLSSGATESQLRVYKGQVLEVARRTPRGPTFVVHAEPAHWCGLLAAPRNEFVIRTNRGEFATTGDAYAYLQLTKALHLLVDAGRELWPTAPGDARQASPTEREVHA